MCYISSLWWHELLHPKTSRIHVNAMEPELLRTHSVPDPLYTCSHWLDSLSVNFERAHNYFHVVGCHPMSFIPTCLIVFISRYYYAWSLSDLNWIWNVFFFFVLQPPPAITDKQLDEREHTVEEWKGGNYLCFYLCFLIKSDWHKSPCWTLLGQCFCSASSTFNLNYRIFWTKSRSGV